MQSIDRPYDIKRRCYLFSKELLLFISTQRYQRIYHSIFDQLLRSGTSIGANVVEGGVGSSKKDVINFYHIALKSANETKYWLCLIRDTIKCEQEKVAGLLSEANEISKIIASSLIQMKKV
ncbi:four helix bundle protein [Pinibacter aurantiacus]|uniref:Four helix bundle protein n=1 Tax=Pinibacter aurantiacus TaxID=2851599 RepID=A0A9E2SBD6_9BACT|nr:four helix bundle protein [Pinibacter aurantiacus]MBV4359856.1 four helix bundle protein [Pinibacter aurantiacus]